MLLEGKNAVREHLSAGGKLNRLYLQKGLHGTEEIINMAKAAGARIVMCERKELDKLCGGEKHRGIAGVADEYSYCTVQDIIQTAEDRGEKLFMLILDGIEDPHNLGSIVRVAECSGVHGIVIPKRRAVGVNATVVKVSAGATAYVKIAAVNNVNDVIRKLKDSFVSVYCADMDGADVYSVSLTEDLALVIGSEGFGVKPLTAKLCDGAVSLPQKGRINSLNASVACGVLCYEVLRQRR